MNLKLAHLEGFHEDTELSKDLFDFLSDIVNEGAADEPDNPFDLQDFDPQRICLELLEKKGANRQQILKRKIICSAIARDRSNEPFEGIFTLLTRQIFLLGMD